MAVSCDLETETLIALCDVARRYPARGGGSKHISVVKRWVLKGVWGVKLEAIQRFGWWYTSEEALGRFNRAIARERAKGGKPPPRRPRERTAEQRQRDSDFAVEYLRRKRQGAT